MKAIALISGGLDSTLAAKLMQNLGVELICLNTRTPFCLCNHRSAKGCFHGAGVVAKELGLRLISIDVSEEFLKIVKQPKHGYGSHMNPCIDCRILLFRKAKEAMQREGASFIITGEVVGQRPMSQKPNTMRLIEKEAELNGLVLRPLSARNLESTIPEKEGWIDREKLLAMNGRGRNEQFNLAAEFGIKDYPCPSGGCLLTDPEFSKRVKDLMRYDEFNLDNVQLLRLGRHFRVSEKTKLVVGRDEKEDIELERLARPGDYLFYPNEQLAGPTSLARGILDQKLVELSAQVTCRYSDLNGLAEADIIYKKIPDEGINILRVAPLIDSELEKIRL